MFTPQSPRRPLAPCACALAIALALSACGGSDNNHAAPAPPPPVGTTPPPGAGDGFFSTVYAKVMQMLDNEEPAAIDQLTETKPENTEPEPVPAG